MKHTEQYYPATSYFFQFIILLLCTCFINTTKTGIYETSKTIGSTALYSGIIAGGSYSVFEQAKNLFLLLNVLNEATISKENYEVIIQFIEPILINGIYPTLCNLFLIKIAYDRLKKLWCTKKKHIQHIKPQYRLVR